MSASGELRASPEGRSTDERFSLGRVRSRLQAFVGWIGRPGMMSYVARGAAVMLTVQLAGSGAAYLSHVLLARWMGAVDFGVYSYALAWSAFLAAAARLGLSSATLRFLPEFSARREWDRALGLLRGGWAIVLGASVASSSVWTVAVLAAARWLRIEHLGALLSGAWIIPPLALISLQAEMARASRRIALAYAPPALGKAVVLILIAALVVRATGTLDADQAILINIGALVLMAGLQLALFWRGLPDEVRAARPVYEPRLWFSVSLPMLRVNGYSLVLGYAGLLLVGAILGPEAVGRYHAAVKTAGLVNLTLSAANTAAAPLYAALHAKGDRDELQRLISTSVGWSFLPSLALFVALVALGRPILGLFGPGFVAARWPLAILAFGQLVNTGAGPVVTLLSVSGHQRECSRVFGWSALLNLLLNVIGIFLLGITGAALATAATMVLWNVWLHSKARRELGIRTRVRWG
ncbi:MAG TPA: polysaccharide biosynthesis C-terminal domain-containing protein [Candidatus Bathyarchaeia archaeon]|nr:polysaccharide biosynthesis C-terminal domain-containing protein [Candidatus Bathyarchaeia archaeon]